VAKITYTTAAINKQHASDEEQRDSKLKEFYGDGHGSDFQVL
jgi:hypothetical protein